MEKKKELILGIKGLIPKFIYPLCETSKDFVKSSNKKSITPRALKRMLDLGYSIKINQIPSEIIMELIHSESNYRIIELHDDYINMKDLKGNCYNPSANPDIDVKVLELQEKAFEEKVYSEGLYGYELQKWSPQINIGWEHVDSCWGFVGTHKDNDHYIIEEYRDKIKHELPELEEVTS